MSFMLVVWIVLSILTSVSILLAAIPFHYITKGKELSLFKRVLLGAFLGLQSATMVFGIFYLWILSHL